MLRIWDVNPGSRILIFTHPGSRISEPGSKISNKREGWKKLVVIPFFVATNFTKLSIILFLKCWRKKFGPIFKELLNFLPKKLSLSFQVWDPGSGKNLFPFPDPGVKKAPDPGSGSATLQGRLEILLGKAFSVDNFASSAGASPYIPLVLVAHFKGHRYGYLLPPIGVGSIYMHIFICIVFLTTQHVSYIRVCGKI